MTEIWRLLDSGLTSPARSIALSRALLEARHADEIPNTLRFSRVTRGVILGFQQSAPQELDVEYCRARGLPLQRRITGGAAWYVDERQLVWELYLHRHDLGSADLRAVAKRLCHAAATALSALGIDARYRARSDIEVDGRMLGSGGFSLEGDAVLFQCMLLIDADVTAAYAPLRTPWAGAAATLSDEAQKRITTVKQALGRLPDTALLKHNLMEVFESEFDVEFREGDLGLTEEARCETALAHVDSSEWVEHVARAASEIPLREATYQGAAGSLHVIVAFEPATRSFKQVWFPGSAALAPRRALLDLEAALRGVPTERLAQRIEWFFASRPIDLRGFAPVDFTTLLLRAAGQRLLAGNP